MSRRQRRRVNLRRSAHVQQVGRRTVVPVVAVAAALAAAPAAAEAQGPISPLPGSEPPPLVIPNSDAPGAGPGSPGMSLGGSVYDWVGGGAYIFSPSGSNRLTGVAEFGFGAGADAAFKFGPNVNAPSAAKWLVSASGSAPGGFKLKGELSAPLGKLSLNATTASGSIGTGVIPGLSNGRLTWNCPLANFPKGCTAGGQYSATGNVFNGWKPPVATADGFKVNGQVKAAIQVPFQIPPPNYTVGGADQYGVFPVTQPGVYNAMAPSVTYFRDVSKLPLSYPIAPIPGAVLPSNGYLTATLYPPQSDGSPGQADGSYTIQTGTSDFTHYGQDYLKQNPNLSNTWAGTLEHQLLTWNGQRTNQYTWTGWDGNYATMDSSGTKTQYRDASGKIVMTPSGNSTITQTSDGLITQRNPDGTWVQYNPSTNTLTASDGGAFGTGIGATITTFSLSNGTVTQKSPDGPLTQWNASGQAWIYGIAVPGLPKPTPPPIPPAIWMPHTPGVTPPADASAQTGASNQKPTGTQNPTKPSGTSTPTPSRGGSSSTSGNPAILSPWGPVLVPTPPTDTSTPSTDTSTPPTPIGVVPSQPAEQMPQLPAVTAPIPTLAPPTPPTTNGVPPGDQPGDNSMPQLTPPTVTIPDAPPGANSDNNAPATWTNPDGSTTTQTGSTLTDTFPDGASLSFNQDTKTITTNGGGLGDQNATLNLNDATPTASGFAQTDQNGISTQYDMNTHTVTTTDSGAVGPLATTNTFTTNSDGTITHTSSIDLLPGTPPADQSVPNQSGANTPGSTPASPSAPDCNSPTNLCLNDAAPPGGQADASPATPQAGTPQTTPPGGTPNVTPPADPSQTTPPADPSQTTPPAGTSQTTPPAGTPQQTADASSQTSSDTTSNDAATQTVASSDPTGGYGAGGVDPYGGGGGGGGGDGTDQNVTMDDL